MGNGTKNFVQNHPLSQDKVIVYTAMEGDEAATFTRGSARLVNGVATVKLSETFQWVTNPDIGLTAHLTPRGEWSNLYVASLSTTEMVVRDVDGSRKGAFDYIVKPFDIDEVIELAGRAIERYENRKITSQTSVSVVSDRIIGDSTSMRELYKLLGVWLQQILPC